MPPLPFDPTPLEHLARAHAATPFRVEEMPGGASTRRFFRVRYDDGASAVGMFFPDALRSEEAADDSKLAGRRWPFLEVRELLASAGVHVPALLGERCAHGWILVEDLGNETLADRLLRSPDAKQALYQTAVRELARAQCALGELPEDSIVSSRAFDATLLRWELDHFREFGLEARGIPLSASQRTRFDHAAQALAELIAAWPQGFVHRDYQSRNLMTPTPATDRLAWVDFQDALLGPRVYDLVALLNDSYQSFDDEFFDARLREFIQHREAVLDFERLRTEFDLVTIQRKLKDAGRFVFIQHNKGDASYLRFIEPTLAKVRSSMRRTLDVPPVRALDELLRELGVY